MFIYRRALSRVIIMINNRYGFVNNIYDPMFLYKSHHSGNNNKKLKKGEIWKRSDLIYYP